MCVICCKPAGVDLPKQEYIDNMWTRNSDGAGIMYALDGRVHIIKGFMDYSAFKEALDNLDDAYDLKSLPMVMHFRITTHGGTKPENCHPFPVTESLGKLQKLVQTTSLGVAHNGIIDITPRKGISDTMEYILSQLSLLYKAVPDFYRNKLLMRMVSNAIDSKMALLTDKGEIYTIGNFEVEDGIMYSNTSYKYGWGFKNSYYAHSDYLLPEHWEVYDYAGKTTYRNIMWLDDGEYVVTPEGDWLEGDFGIDAYGYVYHWDYDYDALVKKPGYAAFDCNGMPLKFNLKSELTVYEEVIN